MPSINVRWATNTEELKRNLAQGLDQIEATRASVDKLVKSLKGEQLAQAANKWAAAIEEVGGVTKLTAQNQERANAIFQRYIEQQKILGAIVPTTIRDLAAQAQASVAAANAAKQHGEAIEKVAGLLKSGLGALGFGFGGAAGIGLLAKQALDVADSLVKLSDRTGIAVEPLQRLGNIAVASGNSLEEVAVAVNKFQKNLADGSADAVIERLGLSVSQLRSLNPDEQFIAIAKAIQGIQDPAEQTLVAMQLFGKGGAEILPTLKAKVEELANASVVMSDRSVKALDAFGDGLTALKRTAISIVGEMIASFISLGDQIDRVISKLPHGAAPKTDREREAAALGIGGPAGFAAELDRQADDFAKSIAKIRSQFQDLKNSSTLGPATIPGLPSAETIAAIEAESKAIAEAAAFAEKVAEAQKELFGADVIERAKILTAALGSVGNISQLTFEQQDKLRDAAQHAADAYKALGQEAPEALQKILNQTNALFAVRKIEAGSTLTGILFGFKTFDPDQEVKPFLEFFAKLKAIEAGTFRPNENPGAIQGPIPGLPLIKDAVKETKDWTTHVDELARAFSHLATVSDGALGETVREIAQVISAFDLALKALRQFQEAIKNKDKGSAALALAGGFAAVLQSTGTGSAGARTAGGALSGAALGAEIGSIIPGIGTALGAAVGAVAGGITGLLRSVFRNTQKEINPLRQSFIDAAGGLGVLNEKAHEAGTTLDAVLNAKNPEEYKKAIDDLTKALDFQNSAMQALDDAIQRYGFALKDLGPAGASHVLSDRAQQIYKDFKLLEAAGVSTDSIIKKMGKSIEQLVRDALKSGASLPAFLKPILEQMIALGQLTDASGHKITSLAQSGIVFDETVSASINNLIDTINRLADAIARAFHISLPTPGGNVGGGGGSSGGGDGGGGRDFAQVVPLLPRGVLPSTISPRSPFFTAAQQAFIAGSGEGGGSVVHNHTHNYDLRGALVDEHGRRALARMLTKHVVQNVAENKDSAYTKLLGATGAKS